MERPRRESPVVVRPPRGRRVGGGARPGAQDPDPLPAPRTRRGGGGELDRWQGYVRGLAWKSLEPWTPNLPGNFRHLHQLFEGKSVLIAYAAKKTEGDHDYYVAAKLDLGLIAKDWIPDEMDVVAGKRRVVILDEVGAGRSTASRSRRRRSSTRCRSARRSTPGGSRSRPGTSPSCARRPRRSGCSGVLLVPVSTVIIAVGLGVVWLSVRAERRTSQLKSDFIANVSHELKTPLSLIRMFGELLATGKHKGEGMAREYAGIITREIRAPRRTSSTTCSTSRASSAARPATTSPRGGSTRSVERALDVLRHRLDKEKMRLRTEIEANLPPVRMDEDAMTLVLLNLVDNAVKYAGDGGEVSVRLRRAPGRGRAVGPRSRPGHRARRAAPDLRALLPGRERPRRATCAAAASAWRWSSTSSRPTAGASRSRARPARARPSRCSCRWRRS